MTEARKAELQAYPEILSCVAFVGYRLERGEFGAHGTCFFAFVREEELDFHYIITCKHVVRGIPAPLVRINRGSKAPLLLSIPQAEWVDHPDRHIDVSAALLDVEGTDSDDGAEVTPINLKALSFGAAHLQHHSLGIGDILFMPSLFVGRVGDRKNIPVLRVATLAALAEEPVWRASPRRPAYLIETRSLGGTSGSPVFLNLNPQRVRGPLAAQVDPNTGALGVPYVLIGMYLGGHSGQYASDFVSDGEGAVVPQDADFNAGIGVVLPIEQVWELLNQAPFREARAATVAAKRAQSGYRPD